VRSDLSDTALPNNDGLLVDSFGNAEFSRDVIAAFPELRADLTYHTELLHPQMGTLAAAVRESLRLDDIAFPLRVCAFLDGVLLNPKAISEIENAVAISCLEAHELRATGSGRLLLDRMPVSVRRLLLEQEQRAEGGEI
jgi:hypothetical protein